jgi:hypothetical protein
MMRGFEPHCPQKKKSTIGLPPVPPSIFFSQKMVEDKKIEKLFLEFMKRTKA